MKKIYLASLLAMAVCANAQITPNATPKIQDVPATVGDVNDRTVPSPVQLNPNRQVYPSAYFGKVARAMAIGVTQNDQQTNASIYRHVHVFPDGKISATWTTSTDGPLNGYMQRGSGYNHFNGESWGPITSVRIEEQRTGFPNYAYSEATSEEFILSHRVVAQGQPNAGAAGGLLFNRKAVSGSTWTSSLILDTTITYPGVLWNRSVVSGDFLHIIASYTDSSQQQPNRVIIDGIRRPQVYSRYKISTSTWEERNVFLPEYDSTRVYAGGGDQYAIDARGDVVAILIGGLTDDLSLWKSTDNGQTWTKTIVDSFPVPAYDYSVTFDTTFSNDGAVNVILDNDNNAHCFWGLARVLDTDPTDQSVSFFPGQTQLMYWNETLPIDSIRSIATTFDEDNNGEFNLGNAWNNSGARYGNHSIVTMPSAATTANGHIYVAYSSLTDNDISPEGRNYRDVYLIRSVDGGETWQGPVNLTGWLGFNIEQIFGSIARTVNGQVNLTFLQKGSIGRYDATNNPGALGPFDIFHLVVDTAGLFGTEPITSLNRIHANDVFTIGQNYPNPARNTTSIDLNLKLGNEATISITNIVGQRVSVDTYKQLNNGVNTIELNVSNMPAGIYFYTVEAYGVKETRRMIIE
jgi:hypothetical protein